eukprot:COSAG02_NODE_16267_length_1098_cov_0.960961_1_plen_217_part_00
MRPPRRSGLRGPARRLLGVHRLGGNANFSTSTAPPPRALRYSISPSSYPSPPQRSKSHSTAAQPSTPLPLFRRPVPQRSHFSHRIRAQHVSRPFIPQTDERTETIGISRHTDWARHHLQFHPPTPPTSSCAHAVSSALGTFHRLAARPHLPSTHPAPTTPTPLQHLPTTPACQRPPPQMVAKCGAKPSRAEPSHASPSPSPSPLPPELSRQTENAR